ncbi:MAG: hypothetical protein AVDCRST_MAG73-3425, partial [uncultured Thermomicrobiales bacterium]
VTPTAPLLRLGPGRGRFRHGNNLLGRALLRVRRLLDPNARRTRLVSDGDDRGVFAGPARFRDRGGAARPVVRPARAAPGDGPRLRARNRLRAALGGGGHAAGVLRRLDRDRPRDGGDLLRTGVRPDRQLVRAPPIAGAHGADFRRRVRERDLCPARRPLEPGARLARRAGGPGRRPRGGHHPGPRPPVTASTGRPRSGAGRRRPGRRRDARGTPIRPAERRRDGGPARPVVPLAGGRLCLGDAGVRLRHGPSCPVLDRAGVRRPVRRRRRRPGRPPGAAGTVAIHAVGLGGVPPGGGRVAVRDAGGLVGRPVAGGIARRDLDLRRPLRLRGRRRDAGPRRPGGRSVRPRRLRQHQRRAGLGDHRRPRGGPPWLQRPARLVGPLRTGPCLARGPGRPRRAGRPPRHRPLGPDHPGGPGGTRPPL